MSCPWLRYLALACAFTASAVTLGACDEHERGEGDDEPFVCEPEDREGTFLLSFAVMKGDCGYFADQRVKVEDVDALPDGCKFDAPDEWAENDCKLRRYYTCVTDLGTSKWTAVTEQHDEDATVLTGVVTVKLTGEQPCMGTYSVRYDRQ
jgi:hypothetical protein